MDFKSAVAKLSLEDKVIGCLHKALGHVCIAHWNDAPERCQADVLALYDRAIEEAAP